MRRALATYAAIAVTIGQDTYTPELRRDEPTPGRLDVGAGPTVRTSRPRGRPVTPSDRRARANRIEDERARAKRARKARRR